MTKIEQTLLQKSQTIFDKLDKWKAFIEMQELKIKDYWLKIGAKRLREYFDKNRSDGWRCEQWGDDLSTQWYLEKFKLGSLAIGLRWGVQLHLHLRDSNRFKTNIIDQQLKSGKYAKLLMPFGVNPLLNASDSKVQARYADFTFGSLNDGNVPDYELAWYAVNRTDDYIKQMAGKIEGFTRDPEMTRLLEELNAEAQI